MRSRHGSAAATVTLSQRIAILSRGRTGADRSRVTSRGVSIGHSAATDRFEPRPADRVARTCCRAACRGRLCVSRNAGDHGSEPARPLRHPPGLRCADACRDGAARGCDRGRLRGAAAVAGISGRGSADAVLGHGPGVLAVRSRPGHRPDRVRGGARPRLPAERWCQPGVDRGAGQDSRAREHDARSNSEVLRSPASCS